MNILVISPVLPYPPNDGDRIRIFNFLKFLSKRNKIRLVSFIRSGEEQNVKFLKEICESVEVVPITKTEIFFNAIISFFSSMPINVGAYKSKKMQEVINDEMQEKKIDLIYVYRIRCAPYVDGKSTPAVIDIVDSMALVNKRREVFEKNVLRKLYIKIDYERILNYERNLHGRFKRIFINSEDDADFLDMKNITVIPNGVTGRVVKKRKKGDFVIGFFGNVEYGPNYDAVTFFYKNVWKKMSGFDKNIKLVITGDKNNSLKFLAGKNVEIKGYIDDIDGEISGWDVSIVPVRYGAGRQNKILKSWACGIPVVATKFAAMGVYGKNKKNLLIADDADEFINAIFTIKRDEKLRKRIISGGFETVKKHFNWEKNLKKLEVTLRKVRIK